MYYELTDHFEVTAPIETVWKFFSSAENLPAITPPWLRFANRSKNLAVIQQDTLLDYTIHWMNVPVKWQTLIIDWSPMRQFIDLQVRGPYSLWHHQHTFEPSPTGVVCRDRVIYSLPLSFLGRLAHTLIVREQLLEIFRYRRNVIGKQLGWSRALKMMY